MYQSNLLTTEAGGAAPQEDLVCFLNQPIWRVEVRKDGTAACTEMCKAPPGLRATDGVWAKYWYKEVKTTTSFRPYKPKDEPGSKPLAAKSYMIVTVPLYVRWDQPEVAQ